MTQSRKSHRPRQSNYEQTKAKAAEAFIGQDLTAIIERFGLDHDDDFLFISMLGRTYRLHRATGLIEGSDDEFRTVHEADPNEAMTIYDKLSHTEPTAHLAGEFVQLRSLAPFQGSAPTLGSGFFDTDARSFNHSIPQLAAVCATLGKGPLPQGDVAYELPLFSDFPVVFRFWEADEEFPPTIQVLFDRNALEFLHYETLWYAASVVIARLSELVVE